MKKLLVVFDRIICDSCKVRPCAGFILHFDSTVRRYYFQFVCSEEVSEQNCLLRLFSTSPPPHKFYSWGSVNYDITHRIFEPFFLSRGEGGAGQLVYCLYKGCTVFHPLTHGDRVFPSDWLHGITRFLCVCVVQWK